MISVVIPLYNKEQSISSTLQSVCDQTYTDIEIVVVNDGSTDNSAVVASTYPDVRIRVINKENGGVSSARNRGIKEAKGENISFLDADDLWDKDYLAEQVRMITDFPEAAMWGINFAEINGGQLIRKLTTGMPEGYRGYVEDYFHMHGRNSDLFCSSSVVIRKEVFNHVGNFDERLKYSEDTDMWWRIIATYPVAFYDHYMVFYRYDAENRALHKKMLLRYDSPYVVDKYQEKQWKEKQWFYQWINQYSAQWIARYLFTDESQREDAYIAAKKLDYSVIPIKYALLFKTPYWFGLSLYRIIQKLKEKR